MLSDIINQQINGEGVGREGDLAFYGTERTDAVAVRDSVVIDLDRSGKVLIVAIQADGNLNTLLKGPLRTFIVYDFNVVGSKNFQVSRSGGSVGR